MVVELLEVDPAGHDRVLLVTSSSRLATRAVRDWLEIQDPAARVGGSAQRTSGRARLARADEAHNRKGGKPAGG